MIFVQKYENKRHFEGFGRFLAYFSAVFFLIYPNLSTAQDLNNQGVQTTAELAGPAESGSGQNFAASNASWNGLSDFIARASSLDIEIEVKSRNTLDWGKLSNDDVVVLIHPLTHVEVDNATRFAVDGGRMLVAIEAGGQSPFLDRLGIQVHELGAEQQQNGRFVRENPALPIFSPPGQHPLLEDVTNLVANHPAVLVNVGGPVVAYPDRSGLVYDMNLGEGKVLVFGDASLFINQMLHVADNGRLAENALRYLCAAATPCRVNLLTGNFTQTGTYSLAGDSDESTAQSWSRWFSELNSLLQRFMNDLPITRLLYYLAVLLAAGLALYLAAVFRLRAGRPYSEHIRPTDLKVPLAQSEYDWNLARFGSGGRETNFVLPLAILKEVFEELFLDALGFWPLAQEDRPTVTVLGQVFRRQYLQDAAQPDRAEREVVDLLATFAEIPTRHRVFLDSDAYYSERDLLRIYRSMHKVLRRMGLEEAYERRTQSLV